jgi:hypothetical protein
MNKRWALVSVLALAIAGCSHHKKMDKEEEEEGNEVKMSMSEVPSAVQDTLHREANGATIGKVDKETRKDGQIVYETDVKQNGKNHEIRVAPDGRLISNKIEEDEEDEKK